MRLPLEKMTLEAFLAWEETQVERYGFVAGEVFAMVGVFHKSAADRFELHDMSDAETLQFASIGCKVAVAEVFAGSDTPAARRPADC